jgi:hypothetical protein
MLGYPCDSYTIVLNDIPIGALPLEITVRLSDIVVVQGQPPVYHYESHTFSTGTISSTYGFVSGAYHFDGVTIGGTFFPNDGKSHLLKLADGSCASVTVSTDPTTHCPIVRVKPAPCPCPQTLVVVTAGQLAPDYNQIMIELHWLDDMGLAMVDPVFIGISDAISVLPPTFNSHVDHVVIFGTVVPGDGLHYLVHVPNTNKCLSVWITTDPVTGCQSVHAAYVPC